jgi:hypothetical protein
MVDILAAWKITSKVSDNLGIISLEIRPKKHVCTQIAHTCVILAKNAYACGKRSTPGRSLTSQNTKKSLLGNSGQQKAKRCFTRNR